MSEVISTQAPDANDNPSASSPKNLLAPDSEHFDRLAGQPQYRHFVRIPGRIMRCLDYFEVPADRLAAEQTLLNYYLFIGVVDQAIDSGDAMTATIVFNCWTRPGVECSETSDVVFMTERLKSYSDDALHPLLLEKLSDLYARVAEERLAASVESYIESRKHVGRLTAGISYLLIRPMLSGEQTGLREFMEQVGAIGCLVDSVIDVRADRERGLLNFEPTLLSQLKLILSTLSEGRPAALAHPRLSGLFLQAIADIVRDRFGRKDRSAPLIVNRIGSEVAGAG